MESNLITPPNFTLEEYLNSGAYSVISESDREKLKEEFFSLPVEEQQKCLSILFALQPYRKHLGFAIFITCGYRSYRHEIEKGRSGDSQHLKFAIDITCETKEQLDQLAALLSKTWYGGFSYYKSQYFIHIDLGNHRRW